MFDTVYLRNSKLVLMKAIDFLVLFSNHWHSFWDRFFDYTISLNLTLYVVK